MNVDVSSEITLSETTFEDIFPIWRTQLWPDRQSPIEKVSAIDPHGSIDLELLKEPAFFWKVSDSSGEILGVVSAHRTNQDWIRSRGLWVQPSRRGQKLATRLMNAVFKKSLDLKAQTVWTMPRQSALGFYQELGFQIYGHARGFEYGPHTLAAKRLDF